MIYAINYAIRRPVMERDKLGAEILKRLDILIALNLDRGTENGLLMADKILKLRDLGVSTADISSILGKPSNYITATLSKRKARQKKGESQK